MKQTILAALFAATLQTLPVGVEVKTRQTPEGRQASVYTTNPNGAYKPVKVRAVFVEEGDTLRYLVTADSPFKITSFPIPDGAEYIGHETEGGE